MLTTHNDNTEIISLILDHKADANLKNIDGKPALKIATKKGHGEARHLLSHQ